MLNVLNINGAIGLQDPQMQLVSALELCNCYWKRKQAYSSKQNTKILNINLHSQSTQNIADLCLQEFCLFMSPK